MIEIRPNKLFDIKPREVTRTDEWACEFQHSTIAVGELGSGCFQLAGIIEAGGTRRVNFVFLSADLTLAAACKIIRSIIGRLNLSRVATFANEFNLLATAFAATARQARVVNAFEVTEQIRTVTPPPTLTTTPSPSDAITTI